MHKSFAQKSHLRFPCLWRHWIFMEQGNVPKACLPKIPKASRQTLSCQGRLPEDSSRIRVQQLDPVRRSRESHRRMRVPWWEKTFQDEKGHTKTSTQREPQASADGEGTAGQTLQSKRRKTAQETEDEAAVEATDMSMRERYGQICS